MSGKTGRGEFFAVGKSQWAQACELGLNPAVALLVIARGTGRDNSTTSWSANAIEEYTGMAWKRAKDAIGALCAAKVLKKTKDGSRPTYKIDKPEDSESLIWLPNELVTGAADEVPPVKRLRQRRDVDLLKLFIELYGEHELSGDGGLPRSLLIGRYERKRICGYGPFEVYGFDSGEATAFPCGPLARYFPGQRKEANPVWEKVRALTETGLLVSITYLAEGPESDAELIVALSGDEHAEHVSDAARAFVESLPPGYGYESDEYEIALPVIKNIAEAVVVDVYRLSYRPRTKLTSDWYRKHIKSCQEHIDLYGRLAAGEFGTAA